jgi:hypothetical protein
MVAEVIPLQPDTQPCMGQCKRPGARKEYRAMAIPGTLYIIIHEADCLDISEGTDQA